MSKDGKAPKGDDNEPLFSEEEWNKLTTWATSQFDQNDAFVRDELEKVKKPKHRKRLLKFIQGSSGMKTAKWIGKKPKRLKMCERILRADGFMNAVFGKE